MKTREHKDRQAFLDRLEEKYSQKLNKLPARRKTIRQSLRTVRGIPIEEDFYLDFEDTKVHVGNKNLAY